MVGGFLGLVGLGGVVVEGWGFCGVRAEWLSFHKGNIIKDG